METNDSLFPDKRFADFIRKHHVLTLATSVENRPYCANCFYVYSEKKNLFVVTSDFETKHIRDVLQNNSIAGTIVLETSIVGKIQGIQFTGKMIEAEAEKLSYAKRKYLLKYPFAQFMNTKIWIIEPEFMKLTDNRLGFGKKLIWKKDELFSE